MKRRYRMFRQKNGSTMVEVLAAFLILMMVMAMVSRTMILAGRIAGHAEEIRRQYEELVSAYYLEEQREFGTQDCAVVEYDEAYAVAVFTSEEGESFELPVKTRRLTGTAGSLYDVVGASDDEALYEITGDETEVRE